MPPDNRLRFARDAGRRLLKDAMYYVTIGTHRERVEELERRVRVASKLLQPLTRNQPQSDAQRVIGDALDTLQWGHPDKREISMDAPAV